MKPNKFKALFYTGVAIVTIPFAIVVITIVSSSLSVPKIVVKDKQVVVVDTIKKVIVVTEKKIQIDTIKPIIKPKTKKVVSVDSLKLKTDSLKLKTDSI